MKRTHQFAAATLAALSLAATAVFAHGGSGMGPGSGPLGAMHGASAPGGPQGAGDPTARMEAHLSALKAELKITPTQEPAWQAFIGQAKQQAQGHQAMRATMQGGTGSAPDRMAQHTEMMKQRVAGMEKMNSALKELYATLTPEQKATADKRFGHMDGSMGGPMGSRMGGHAMAHHGL